MALPAQEIRAARLVVAGLFWELEARLDFSPASPWSLPFAVSPPSLAELTGLTEGEVRAAVTLLRSRGVLLPGPEGERLCETLFGPDPEYARLDWQWILTRLRGDSPALLVVRAMADLIRPLDEDRRVSLADLERRTGYGKSRVRHGVTRALDALILERHNRPGKEPEYRFTSRALGAQPPSDDTPRGSTRPEPPPPPPSVGGSSAPSAAAPSPSGEVPVRLGPVRLHISASDPVDIHLTVGADGRVTYRGPGFEIGPLDPD